MPSAFNYDPTINSSIGCKLYNYFAYGMDALSPWCLVYISFERFIATKYYDKRFLYKKKMYQIIFLILLFLFNILYHINIIFSFDILTIDNTTLCYFNNDENQIIVANMDLTNFFLLPFILMFLCSICLIISIFKARSSVNLNNTARETRHRKKDIKLSISLLSMNLLFLLLNLPIVISQYLPFDSDIYTIVSNIYYISYAVNFYILLFTNSLFRNSLFYKKKQKFRKNLDLNKNQVNSNQNKSDRTLNRPNSSN
jgi:hypothetical protein